MYIHSFPIPLSFIWLWPVLSLVTWEPPLCLPGSAEGALLLWFFQFSIYLVFYPSCWEATHLNRWFLPAVLVALFNWTQWHVLFLLHKGTLNDTTSQKLLKLRMVFEETLPKGHTLPGVSGNHCSSHGLWDTPKPVVETQRRGSLFRGLVSPEEDYTLFGNLQVWSIKGRGEQTEHLLREHDNQGESQLAARQCSLLRAQKGTYSGQCEAGWDQGMIVSVSERSSAGRKWLGGDRDLAEMLGGQFFSLPLKARSSWLS